MQSCCCCCGRPLPRPPPLPARDEPHTHDERLTTFEAKGERMARGGQRGSYRDNPVDAIAAALLLQGWLEANTAQS